ncbi:MAG: metallopeptidase family protein [Pseudomonadota bacterium]
MDDPIAPTLDDFQAMAEAAFEGLPQAFRDKCEGVLIRVSDFAAEDVLRDMSIEDPFELTGLYEGVALTEKSSSDSGALPDQVWLYRRPILDEWAERADVGIFEMVVHVLVHEIGHHFGLTDDEIAAIEARSE